MVHVVNEQGYLVNAYEFYNAFKAKELLNKWFKDDVEWVDRSWEHEGLKRAIKSYETNVGVTMTGRIL